MSVFDIKQSGKEFQKFVFPSGLGPKLLKSP